VHTAFSTGSAYFYFVGITSKGEERVSLSGPSAAWMPPSSLQGGVHGVTREASPLLPRDGGLNPAK